MRRTMIIGAAIVLCMSGAASARDLTVPADKGWKHAATGLVLRPTLAGLPRTAIADSTQGEWDVSVQFNDPDIHESTTLYLFHAAAPDVAIWFDRASWALEHRPGYGGVRAIGPAVAFVPPRQTIAAGLRRIYVPANGPVRSSAVAVLPLGEWLVALRVSSTTLDAAGLEARLTATIAAIGWPTDMPASSRTAVPIAACPDHLSFKKAKPKKPDMQQALLGSLIAGIAAGRKDTPADDGKLWCREGDASDRYAAYRREGSRDGYLLALGDSGRTVSVYPAIALPPAPAGDFAVAATDIDGNTATYPSFDALPRPDQVLDLLGTRAPMSRASRSGKDVNIDIDAKSLPRS